MPSRSKTSRSSPKWIDEISEETPVRCLPTRRARSSSTAGTRARARRGGCAVERPAARAAGGAAPTGRPRRGRRDPLLRAGAFPVAAGTAEGGVDAVLGDRVQQRHRLQAVARRARAGLVDDAARVDRVLRAGPPAPRVRAPGGRGTRSPREVVARVDVHDRGRGRRPRANAFSAGRSGAGRSLLAPGTASTGLLSNSARHLADDMRSPRPRATCGCGRGDDGRSMAGPLRR